MTDPATPSFRFQQRRPEDYPDPDANPYLRLHLDFGPPVVTAAQAQEVGGDWRGIFGREAPLHVEIGSGNGFYLAGMAQKHPEWSWLGIEIRFKRVILVARKLRTAGVQNARIARYDAFSVEEILPAGGVAGLYVNHPDPWPKGRHAKHRLLARPFGEFLCRVLAPGAPLRIKTDSGSYVEEFLAAVKGLPLTLLGRSDSIARDGTPWPAADDVITNYQRKFNERGLSVYGVWFVRE
ncbi:MAG: tRNA (guanine(46)-N(7))-methyltransferase TrmB [Pseudomonadota bacterium]